MQGYVVERPQGTISVTPAALSRIVVEAAERVDGARVRRPRRPRRAVDVAVTGGRARVSLELAARYGVVLPELARAVQVEVHDALSAMCGLEVEAVDVSIEELT